jgi:catechol 2,3-dioxygenase-like lactoylglutathione lyase family enzyme
MLNDVRTHTTLPVQDPVRAKAFYADSPSLR